MRLVIRDIVKNTGDEIVLAGASYSFSQGRVYGIAGSENARQTLLDCIAFEKEYDDGIIRLDCGGKDCYAPCMVAQFPEDPMFPEFLTVREFLKYYIEINKKNIDEPKSIEDYLEMVDLKSIRANRAIKDFTWEERIRLQFLCFLISTPPVLIISNLKKISNVDFLKNVKEYVDKIKENGIVLLGNSDEAVAKFLCDEELIIEKGLIRGGI